MHCPAAACQPPQSSGAAAPAGSVPDHQGVAPGSTSAAARLASSGAGEKSALQLAAMGTPVVPSTAAEAFTGRSSAASPG
jgi:hypothetical protein